MSGNYELRKLVRYPTIASVDYNLVIEYLISTVLQMKSLELLVDI